MELINSKRKQALGDKEEWKIREQIFFVAVVLIKRFL